MTHNERRLEQKTEEPNIIESQKQKIESMEAELEQLRSQIMSIKLDE